MLDADRPDAREAHAPLDLTFDLTRVGWGLLAWTGVFLVATAIRLVSLRTAALAPDEARAAFGALTLFTGGAAFDSGATGPVAPLFGALVFFLFGVSDAIARVGPALAGVGTVALLLPLRPYLGRTGALLAGLLLALSPSFAYFSRRVEPYIYAQFFALLLFLALLRLLDHGRRGDLLLAAVAGALLFGAAPTGPTLLLILAALIAYVWLRDRAAGLGRAEGDRDGSSFGAGNLAAALRDGGLVALVAALATLVVAFSAVGTAPANLSRGSADLLTAWATSLLGPTAGLPGRGPAFSLALLPLYEPLALLAGLLGAIGTLARGGYGGIVRPRRVTVTRGLLAGWALAGLALLALGGGQQPHLVLLPALPLTLLAGLALADLVETTDWSRDGWFWRGGGALLALVTLLALAAWGSTGGLLLRSDQYTNQQSQWYVALFLTAVIFALPLTGVAYWLAQTLGGGAAWRALALLGAALLLTFGIRSAIGLSVYRGDSAAEPLVYQASTPQLRPALDRLDRLSRDATAMQRNATDPTGGHGLSIVVDPAVEWPARWYLRDYPALQVGSPADLIGSQPQVIIQPPTDAGLPGYTRERYRWTWSYPAAQPLSGGGNNALLRMLGFLFYRYHVAPAPSNDLEIAYDANLAARLFPAAPAQGPFSLRDRAGQGRAPGQFSGPRGVAIGRDGAVYVVDMLNTRVQQFSRDGAFVRQFGGLGRGDGQFQRERSIGPTGIATDSDGFVYVADTWNHRIQKFTPEGAFVAKWGSYNNLVAPAPGAPQGDRNGFYGPRGIAITPNGEVFVTDTGNARVVVFKTDGQFVREFGQKGSGPNQLNEPVGIAVSADGARVFVADSANARIAVFDPQGQPLAQWPVQSWQGRSYFEPYLALDAEGNLYATSSATRQVLKLNRDGRVVASSTGTEGEGLLGGPMGIAVGPDAVYVADSARNYVAWLHPLPNR